MAPNHRRALRALVVAVAVGTGSLVPVAGVAHATTFTNSATISVPLPGGPIQTAASPYPSNIAVSGLSGTVTDVNVTLCGLRATYPSDVDVMLVAPNGTRAVLMSDVGGDGERDASVDNVTVTLDDAARGPLPGDSTLGSGTYRPRDDDTHEFDADLLNVDVFSPPAPSPTDRLSVFRPSSGVWFFRGDADNVALSSFNGGNPNGTWSLYVMDDIAASPEDGEAQRPALSCGWSIDVTAGGSGMPAGNGTAVAFGTNVDVPVPGDYDGNGSMDVAVFRPSSGTWFIQGGATVAWGTSGDIPVPGDYDADGDTDIAVFRPSNGLWFVNGRPAVAFGTNGDIPVPADYDGDDDTEMAIFRPANGYWFVNGPLSDSSIPTVAQWGANGDIPVPGDYDRNGTAGIAVFRPSSGVWFIRGGEVVRFGTNGDMPVPGDYNNDGTTDVAVYRPSTGMWFVRGGVSVTFGTAGDHPLPISPAVKLRFFS